MKEEKVLSVVFPTELIVRDGQPFAIVRASQGQPLRVCEVGELSTVFSELLKDYQEAVEKMQTVSVGNR